eukprot:GILK01007478.1.p1 GENE.GILK01007478.1~~GILK01007478.1.p1  ORF type:complete len:333 (-),score=37.76 GILK01007478.1:278-1219(-)
MSEYIQCPCCNVFFPIDEIVKHTDACKQLQKSNKAPSKGSPFSEDDRALFRAPQEFNDLCRGSQILPLTLYLGGQEAAEDVEWLQRRKITHVMNTAAELSSDQKLYSSLNIAYKHFALNDTPECPIEQVFEQATDWIHEAVEKDGRVLVHCAMGISRSCTIVIAYLMRFHCWSFKVAFKHVRDNRRACYPNEGFLRSLIEYEFQLFGRPSLDLRALTLYENFTDQQIEKIWTQKQQQTQKRRVSAPPTRTVFSELHLEVNTNCIPNSNVDTVDISQPAIQRRVSAPLPKTPNHFGVFRPNKFQRGLSFKDFGM